MKNLKLYIDTTKVDMNEESLVVMNYTLEELANPTIVKNSYSQQISIPSTPNNDALFGNIYRLDRKTLLSGGYLGVGFNPLVRTPFTIYNSIGEIVERGYMKLDNIKRVGADITYSISLYGGLGSFFYTLSYNEEGDKMTLADLAYIDGSKGELDFNINTANVVNAWNTLKASGEATPPSLAKWRVINFVPAYNGIPDNFDADKAIAKITDAQGKLSAFGMALSKTEDGKTYSTIDGYTLLNLGGSRTGEDLKEFRSYLQRPAISIGAMFRAIQDYASSKGFGLQLDPGFFNPENPYYSKAWMLLPPMTSIEVQTDKKNGSLAGGNGDLFTYRDIPLQFSTDVADNGTTTIRGKATMTAKTRDLNPNEIASDIQALGKTQPPTLRFTKPSGVYNICCIMQLVGVTANGTEIGSDLVVWMDDETSATASTLVSNLNKAVGYVPVGGTSKIGTAIECRGYFNNITGWVGDEAELEVSGDNLESAYLRVVWNNWNGYIDDSTAPHIYANTTQEYIELPLTKNFVDFNGTFVFESFTGARTNTLITKQSLLRSDKTPIDYLISYAKTFGLLFSFDKATNVVTLQSRDEWFARGKAINISERIDYSQDIEIVPNKIDSRYLEFNNESEGAFVAECKAQSGRIYGSARVDTGSAFNKDTKTAIDNNVFKGAAEVCRRSKYNTLITQGGQYVPSVYVDAVTYTLYNGGDKKEFAVTNPGTNASIEYLNADYPTYDEHTRLQLHDAEEKPSQASDILVFYRGTPKYTDTEYQRFRITDDNDYMSILNEGKPCWSLDVQGTLDTSLPLPSFGRYLFAELEDYSNGVTHSLDFGIPAQIDIPNVTHLPDAHIIARRWQAFLADQYDVDTRIVRAKVDLRGYQVGESLLRNLYYFEGCYWVMNRIVNYSMTSDAPVECEFIKVQNASNYKESQSF